MENKKEFSNSVLALVAIVLAAVLLLTGLNFITAPLIAENGGLRPALRCHARRCRL